MFSLSYKARQINQLPSPPKRIISLVPSQTELLYHLGLDEEVVGITKFCIHPNQWFRNKQRVGGTKNVSIDIVRSLQPDLVIANKEENVKDQVEAISQFAPVWVSDVNNLADALNMIKIIGLLVGRQAKAIDLTKEIFKAFEILQCFRESFRHEMPDVPDQLYCGQFPAINLVETVKLTPLNHHKSLTDTAKNGRNNGGSNQPLTTKQKSSFNQPSINKLKLLSGQLPISNQQLIRTVYLIWRDPYMTVGGDTFISDMMQRAGFINVFQHQSRYPSVTINQLANNGCQLLLLSTEPYPFQQKHINELQQLLPNTIILLADGEMFSWYGSRLLLSAKYFEGLIQTIFSQHVSAT